MSYEGVCVTGHRPGKLYGYDLTVPNWLALKEKFKSLLVELECDEAITGMALRSVWQQAVCVCVF